jgi:hypothetical protein
MVDDSAPELHQQSGAALLGRYSGSYIQERNPAAPAYSIFLWMITKLGDISCLPAVGPEYYGNCRDAAPNFRDEAGTRK